MSARAKMGPCRPGVLPFGSDSGAGPSQSFTCSQEKREQDSSTFPGTSLELLNSLQKVLARRVFSDYQPAGWEWISAEMATSLLRAAPLASTHTPEVRFESLLSRNRRKGLSSHLALQSASSQTRPALGSWSGHNVTAGQVSQVSSLTPGQQLARYLCLPGFPSHHRDPCQARP